MQQGCRKDCRRSASNEWFIAGEGGNGSLSAPAGQGHCCMHAPVPGLSRMCARAQACCFLFIRRKGSADEAKSAEVLKGHATQAVHERAADPR